MPVINKIRLTNIVYEEGNKRYNDELFLFAGHNGAILLENGGGKTVFIQTVLQGMIPHTDLAGRQIKKTLMLQNAPAHIAIEWILNEKPRRYVVTAVTLFMTNDGLDSLRYVYEYDHGDKNSIEHIPFVREGKDGKRPADRGEMQDYYHYMKDQYPLAAQTFATIKEYRKFIDEQYNIIAEEWESIVKINSTEGGVEAFFESCKSTNQLFDRLLIPTVEQSIAGHNPNLFADMFEKQYDSLKQYKKLKETIEENKRIQGKLENYVETFEQLHQAEKVYEQSKEKAKGIWEEIQKEKTDIMIEQKSLEQQLINIKEKEKEHEIKKSSYEIGVQKETYEQLLGQFEVVNGKFISKQEELNDLTKELYSLKFAKNKKQLRHFEQEIKLVEREMQKLQEKEELQDLQEELEREKQALHGYFLEKIDGIKKEMADIQFELRPIHQHIEKLEHEMDENKKLDLLKQNERAKVQNTIQTRLSDMDKAKQFLLANPEQEKVEMKLDEWQKRHQFLDEEMIRLSGEMKRKRAAIDELEEQLKEQRGKKYQLENEIERIQYDKKQIELEQTELIKKLTSLRPQWATLTSIYENEQSIVNRLMETIEKLTREKNELLFKERVAYRFVDDYGKQDIFFSDPIIEQRLKTWKNQFDYCVTGIEYIQMLQGSDYEQKAQYPLWAVTIVTTKKSKELLQKKVKEIADQLRFPIQILTTEEAAEIDNVTIQHQNRWVIPSYWHNSLVKDQFTAWQEKIKFEAQEVTKARIEKEKELKKWENVLLAFQEFIDKFPYEKLAELHTKLSKTLIENDQLKREIETNEHNKIQLERQINEIDQLIHQYKDELQGLERKIEKGYEYLKYRQEVKEARLTEKRLTAEIETIKLKLQRLKEQWHEFISESNVREERKRNLEFQLYQLEQNEYYNEVRSLKPLFTGEGQKIILYKIQRLQMKIDNVTESYGALNEKRTNAQQNITRLKKEMEELQKEYEHIDVNREFPSDGEQWIQSINEKIKEGKKELIQLNELVKENASAKDQQYGIWKVLVEKFHTSFPDMEIVTFFEPLEEVKMRLKEEKQKLTKEKKYVNGQLENVNNELKRLDEAERLLEKFIEKHHFNAPHVKQIPLHVNEQMEFRYNRKKFVKNIIQELEQKNNDVQREKEKVNVQKQKFKQFCLTISDMKLRKMAENGVEFKTNYKDLLEFKNNMMTSVERATNYANEHIRQKDEELQAYINQIHTHLKTVAEELRQIPKKTRIKVDDTWKTIFVFKIPEWDEETGKQRIRDYVEKIMSDLESERYIKENGLKDQTKIRQDVEKWLQTKQLLHIVMNDEGMKVNCRKVTNENKVTTRSYSWEQSNVWSGGEKWSKNMTLFLGLLNYIGEKKHQHKTNMKRNRAVILDNPFGKASSEHVLSPVFFVGEQLGFQIIALTAHAEGKFLQDYFPIIYSCRLREAKQGNKQIMTKEKLLHSAYFQDHEPEAIEELTETEQMSLF